MKHTTCTLLTIFLALFLQTRCHLTEDEEAIENSLQRRNAVHRDKNKIWNATGIPYVVDATFPLKVKTAVEKAINIIQSNTCLRFKQRTNEKHYMNFYFDQKGSGCSSGLGVFYRGATKITLSKHCSAGPIIHEMFHSLGFYHEQNRPDAGKYVTYNESNAVPSFNWTLRPYGIDDNGNDDGKLEIIGPYDYRSIMHYQNFGMSRKGRGGFTLTNKLRKDMDIGSEHLPTKMDYLKLSVYYKCSGLSIPYGSKGQWGPWGAWTPEVCPTRCGPDYQQRFRWCNGNMRTDCPGLSTEIRRCDNCAGSKCKNTEPDSFCANFADCADDNTNWKVICRKHCQYCGQPCTNKMTDFYCLYYAKLHCSERWAQKECPVTCNSCDIDECESGTHNCHVQATCANTIGSFTCTCTSGYTGDGVTCQHADCKDLSASCHKHKYKCQRRAVSAWEKSWEKWLLKYCQKTCNFCGLTDIDECESGTHKCHGQATCANTVGSFTCTCNSGYTGDGATCHAICKDAISSSSCNEHKKHCQQPAVTEWEKSWEKWLIKYCKKTCNYCGLTGCSDKEKPYCSRLNKQGYIPDYCNKYPNIRKKCKKTCGDC